MSEHTAATGGNGRVERTGSVLRRQGWRPSTWLLVTGAMLVEVVVTFLGWAYVMLLYAGVCNEPATAADLRLAPRDLLVMAVLACVPWVCAVGVARHRHRLRVAAFGVRPSCRPSSGGQALRATPMEWTSGWCLY